MIGEMMGGAFHLYSSFLLAVRRSLALCLSLSFSLRSRARAGTTGAVLGAEMGAMGLGMGSIVATVRNAHNTRARRARARARDLLPLHLSLSAAPPIPSHAQEAILLGCGCRGMCSCRGGMGMGMGMGGALLAASLLSCGCRGSCGCGRYVGMGYGGSYGGGYGGGVTVIQQGPTYVQQPRPLMMQPQYGAPPPPPPSPGYYGAPSPYGAPAARPLSAHAFFGCLANVTEAVRALAPRGSVPVAPSTFQCDPAPGVRKGAIVFFQTAGGGAHGKLGAAEGSALALPPGAAVTLALFGAFSDATAYARSRCAGHVFDVPVVGLGDPAPGCAAQRGMYVLVEGGANGIALVAAAPEGAAVRIDLTGRVQLMDRCG